METKGKVDYEFHVKIWGGRYLNERGWDELNDAIAQVDLVNVIEQAVLDALNRELPHQHDDHWVDWYELRVEEQPYYRHVPPGRPDTAPEASGPRPEDIVPPVGA